MTEQKDVAETPLLLEWTDVTFTKTKNATPTTQVGHVDVKVNMALLAEMVMTLQSQIQIPIYHGETEQTVLRKYAKTSNLNLLLKEIFNADNS